VVPYLLIGVAATLLTVAATAKAAVDSLTHQAGNCVFEQFGPWWDARTSWKNKYKDYDNGDMRPAFPGAKGPLVLLTDFWHFADFVYLTAYLLSATAFAFIVYDMRWWQIAAFLVFQKIAFGFVFELFYRHTFRVKK
jgi:hypothetical protein